MVAPTKKAKLDKDAKNDPNMRKVTDMFARSLTPAPLKLSWYCTQIIINLINLHVHKLYKILAVAWLKKDRNKMVAEINALHGKSPQTLQQVTLAIADPTTIRDVQPNLFR